MISDCESESISPPTPRLGRVEWNGDFGRTKDDSSQTSVPWTCLPSPVQPRRSVYVGEDPVSWVGVESVDNRSPVPKSERPTSVVVVVGGGTNGKTESSPPFCPPKSLGPLDQGSEDEVDENSGNCCSRRPDSRSHSRRFS